jgi:hypothetical protein
MSAGDIYYRVSYADRVLEHLPTLEARATAAGREEEYTRALATINAWLRSDPATLGEPVRDYPALRLTEYMGVHGPLAITYTIHWDIPFVFVGRYLRIVRWAGF